MERRINRVNCNAIPHPRQADHLRLVPNQRVRERCQADAFGERESQVLVAPAVEVFSQWVSDTATRLKLLAGRPVPASVSPLALRIVWHQAVAENGGPADHTQRQILARRARAADRELKHWLPGPDSPWLDSDFRTWRGAVTAALQQRMQYSPEGWIDLLARHLLSVAAPVPGLPRRITLHGFLEITALEQRLLDGLQACDVDVTIEHYEPREGAVCKVRMFKDPQTELRAAADWARAQHDAGRRRIAVVVNGLEGQASDVRRAFDRRIAGRRAGNPAVAGARYHLPGGATLAEQGVVADALLLLGIGLRGPRQPLSFPTFSRLLLSPFLAGANSERHARAVLEHQVRRDGYYRRSLHELAYTLRRSPQRGDMPEMAALLARPPQVESGTDPAQAFRACLLAWGWPGPGAVDALTSASVNRFVKLFEELRVPELTDSREALTWLEQACRDTPVTERGGPLSAIQVLSPEDAVGGVFEAAWIVNVHAENWPGHVTANPFFPAAAADHVPRATADGKLAYARRLQAALCALAPEVVFSWAQQGGDVPRVPSPLVVAQCHPDRQYEFEPEPVQHGPWADMGDPGADTWTYTGHPWLDAVDDAPGVPLPASARAHVPSAAGMLRVQSACPWAAYLGYRLQARFEPMPGPFADRAYRGQLMHSSLEALFADRAGRPGLPADADIADAVDRALGRHAAIQRLSRAGYAAERERLCRLLRDWLAFEQSRAGYTVAAVESRQDFAYREVTLTTRLDRIDRLSDGRLLIIDYKSGRVEANGWSAERLREPQLPLYAVLLEREGTARVGGLALAAVRPGECEFSGIVDDPEAAIGRLYAFSHTHGLARHFEDWKALRTHLESGITGLLDEIIDGCAENRAHDPNTLVWTGLEPVLRHTEGAAWLTAHGALVSGADND